MASMTVAVVGSAHADSTAAGKPVVPLVDAAAALAQAAVTGKPVTATALTTATQVAVASPNGTMTMTFDVEPVRFRQADGTWAPVDTTLTVVGGSVVPKAAAVDVAFSDGGSAAALATMTRGSVSYRVWAPWALPKPVLSGSTAVYLAVLPGVDLVVTALPDGFSDDLVVNTREAAANPQLAAVTFPVSMNGLSRVQDPVSGTVTEWDAQGGPVFSEAAPMMWDSAGTSPVAGSAAASAAATSGSPRAHVATMGFTATAASETLVPDAAMLASPSTVFPVTLDPKTTSSSISGWSVLDMVNHATAYWKSSPNSQGFLSVGYDGYSTFSVRRSVVQFDTSALAGKTILGATFTPYEMWSASCTAYETDVYRTSAISASTSWDHPPTWVAEVDHKTFAHGWDGSGSTCAAQSPVDFDVTAAVKATAGASTSTTTLGMRATASGESTLNDWKQFASPTSAQKPVLSVTYLTPPTTPTAVKMSSPALSCATSSASPAKIATTTPTLQATVSDADGASASLRANFQVFNGSTLVWSGNSSGWVASGAAVTATTPALSTGIVYSFNARNEYHWSFNGASGSVFSSWSSSCYFTVDTTAPAAPAVTSEAYPPCATPDSPDTCPASGGVGQPAAFTFSAGSVSTFGAAEVTTFLYTLNSGPQQTVAATKTSFGGFQFLGATPSITPDQRGLNVLQVQARDGAGNTSTTVEYDFAVAPGSAPVGVWNLDETGGLAAADTNTRGTAHPATVAGGTSWTTSARNGGAIELDGATGYAATSGPVVDTSKSFTVSAWVRMFGGITNTTVVSQSGVHENGFALGLVNGTTWVFTRPSADATTRTLVQATSPATAKASTWTHLVGVYDSVAGTLTLYVNGVPGGAVAYTTPWNATGSLQIGRRLLDDVYLDYAHERVDLVQVWDRIVPPQEISDNDRVLDAASGLPSPVDVRDHPVSTGDGASIADASPYGNALTLSASGASVITDASRGAVLTLDGTAGYGSGTYPVDSQGSFTATAWVNLNSSTLGTGARTAQVLSQAGSNQASWGLWYQQAANQPGFWYFGRTSSDAAAGVTKTTIASDSPVQPDTWVMLTIVYDAPQAQMDLYVDGVRQGSGVHFASPWQAGGAFTVGRGLTNAAWGGYFPGSVDDVSVWTGITDQNTIFAQFASEV